MIQPDCLASIRINDSLDLVSDFESALLNRSELHIGVAAFLRIVDTKQLALIDEDAPVADLATRLRIERCGRKNHGTIVAGPQFIDSLAITKQGDDFAGRFGARIAEEFRVRISLQAITTGDTELACGTSALALSFHCCVKALLIDREIALTGYVSREIHRKPIGVVKLENEITGQLLTIKIHNGGL